MPQFLHTCWRRIVTIKTHLRVTSICAFWKRIVFLLIKTMQRKKCRFLNTQKEIQIRNRNYPKRREQKQRIITHAKEIVSAVQRKTEKKARTRNYPQRSLGFSSALCGGSAICKSYTCNIKQLHNIPTDYMIFFWRNSTRRNRTTKKQNKSYGNINWHESKRENEEIKLCLLHCSLHFSECRKRK